MSWCGFELYYPFLKCSAKSPDFVAIPIGSKHKPKIGFNIYLVGTKSGDVAKWILSIYKKYLLEFYFFPIIFLNRFTIPNTINPMMSPMQNSFNIEGNSGNK